MDFLDADSNTCCKSHVAPGEVRCSSTVAELLLSRRFAFWSQSAADAGLSSFRRWGRIKPAASVVKRPYLHLQLSRSSCAGGLRSREEVVGRVSSRQPPGPQAVHAGDDRSRRRSHHRGHGHRSHHGPRSGHVHSGRRGPHVRSRRDVRNHDRRSGRGSLRRDGRRACRSRGPGHALVVLHHSMCVRGTHVVAVPAIASAGWALVW